MELKDILKTVNSFKNSTVYENMVIGEKYFKNQCDILNRKFYYYPMSVRTLDPYRANNKIVDNFFRTLVEQKVSYCLAKDVIIQNYNPLIDINSFIDDMAEEASIKGVSWAHPYINALQSIKVVMIPSEEIIPIFDETLEKNLLNIIRTYKSSDKTEYVEFWDNEKVIYYIKDKNNTLIQTNEQAHPWGIVPFVPLYNNRYEMNDLENIKALIDSFDKCVSDFANNFEDFQDVYYKLKNYVGSTEKLEDIANITEFLKQQKMIPVSDNGDFEAIQLEIPHIARGEYLQMIRELIFLFGQGVDTDALSGGSLTNVVIKARFANLEQKCNKFMKFVKRFIEEIMYFDVKYKTITGNSETDTSKMNVVFNTTLLINENEKIESLSKATNGSKIMSTETAVESNPFVDDANVEIQKLNNESKDSNNSGDNTDLNNS